MSAISVRMLADSPDDPTTDDTALAILQADPAWTWLHDADEDVYTEEDVVTGVDGTR